MKAIFTRYTVSSMLEDTGDDYCFIHVYFKLENKPEYSIPHIVSYDDLLEFICIYDSETGKYLKKIRYDIHGYGPKHSKVFKVMEDENFDLEPFIIKYLESKDVAFFEQFDEWCVRLQQSSGQNTVKEKHDIFKGILTDEYRNYNIKGDAYKDALDQAIHEVTFRYFPDLFEKSDKHIAAYRNKLINTTLSFYSEIDKILHDKFNSHWEERYNETQQNK